MDKTIVYSVISFISGIIVLPWVFIVLVPFCMTLFDLVIVPALLFKMFSYSTSTNRNIRILMVDDTPETLIVLKKVLNEKKCKITIVNSGQMAIEQLQKNDFDLLIIDNYMQELNGADTLKQADQIINARRNKNKLSRIPVIEYSSCNEDRINLVNLNNFKMIAKLSKKMPSSNLRPSVSNLIEDIKAEAV